MDNIRRRRHKAEEDLSRDEGNDSISIPARNANRIELSSALPFTTGKSNDAGEAATNRDDRESSNEPVRRKPEIDPDTSSQTSYHQLPLKDMIGKACRDCINVDFSLKLNRNDCVYDRRPDGHRVIERCPFCSRSRPIVKGLKLTGRIKAFGVK